MMGECTNSVMTHLRDIFNIMRYLTILFGLNVSLTFLQADDRPNIVIIMVDDMGWSDLGCFGGEVETPNIDSLATGGVRFTNFYNTGRCCPTRAALLTGVYPHQAGLGRMTFRTDAPGYQGELGRNVVTIAEVLKEAGYQTGMVGKWHLSLTEEHEGHMRHLNNQEIRNTFADPAAYPVGRGFDEHYGVIWGVVNFFDPFSLVDGTEPIHEVSDDFYLTDALSDRAVDMVGRFAEQEQPFFLYLAHCAPHWPLHALPEDIAKYEEVYHRPWRELREARYQRQLEMGLLEAETAPLSLPEGGTPWVEHPHQNWEARRMACHAAMIDRVDQGVGRLIDQLRETGELDNTLILVLSDNGASREEPDRPGFDRVSQTREGEDVVYYVGDSHREILPGVETTYAGIGPRWANLANTPFRQFKATQYEGGIRTPLIAHWPAGITLEAGSIATQPGHVIDFMATCVDVAGADYPTEYAGQEILPMEGLSLRTALHGARPSRTLCFEHFGARAIRDGDWKLVSPPNGDWELYNLASDSTETINVADAHSDAVERLSAMWQQWAERCLVFPQPD